MICARRGHRRALLRRAELLIHLAATITVAALIVAAITLTPVLYLVALIPL